MRFSSWLPKHLRETRRSNAAEKTGSAARRPLRKPGLRIDELESRLAPATVTWDGLGGNLLWTTAANWNPNNVPTAIDDVVINSASGTVTLSSGAVSVRSLTSAVPFAITGTASLNVTVGASSVASLSLAPDTSVTASGPTATFTSPGATSVNGASVLALAGGSVTLPGLTAYIHAGNDQSTAVFRADGPNSLVDLRNITNIAGSTALRTTLSVEAINGGKVDLRAVVNVNDPITGDQRGRATRFKADGLNSLIDLTALTSIVDRSSEPLSGYPGYSGLQATTNGTIVSPALNSTSITEFVLDASGTLNLPQLATATGGVITDSFGRLALPALTTATANTFTLGGTNRTYPVLASAVGATFNVTGVNLSLPVLANASQGSFTINGGTLSVPQLSNIDGASFIANNGGAIAVLAATGYANPNGDFSTVNLRADGPGSVLDLRNVTFFTGSTILRTTINIEALNGGKVDLRAVANITDPIPGDLRGRATRIKADGLNSLVDLSALKTIVDQSSEPLSGYPGYSGIQATTNGMVLVPLLNAISATEIILDQSGNLNLPLLAAATGSLITDPTGRLNLPALATATSSIFTLGGVNRTYPLLASAAGATFTVTGITLSLPVLSTVTGGTFTVNGGTLSVPQLSNINGASFIANNGSAIAVLAATTYANSNGDMSSAFFRADGPGSLVDLRNLTAITGSTILRTPLNVEAINGGKVDLRAVGTITDPVPGDLRGRSTRVKADGLNSVVDLSALTSMTDRSSEQLFAYPGYSALQATTHGTILTPLLASVSNTEIVLDQTGNLGLPVLATAASSLITDPNGRLGLPVLSTAALTTFHVGGSNRTYPLLASAEGATFNVNGMTLGVPLLAEIDSAHFFIAGGGSMALPAATSYTYAGGDQTTVTLRADGANSVLDLRNITTISGSAALRTTINIEALSGGKVDLRGVTAATDPVGGDMRGRAIRIKADGVNSLVNLSALASFTDRSNEPLSGFPGSFGLQATTNGVIQLPASGTAVAMTEVVLGSGGSIVGSLILDAGSILQGSGMITGNVTSSGVVRPGGANTAGQLNVTGNYTQTTTGALEIDLGGIVPGTNFDLLTVGGTADVANSLSRIILSGFVPSNSDVFQFLAASSRTGVFTVNNGVNLGGNRFLNAVYFPSAVALVVAPSRITVTPTSVLTTTEVGGTASFSVALAVEPTEDVIVPITTGDATEGTVGVNQLTFTRMNWTVPQTVTVTGVFDGIVDGDQLYNVVVGAATSLDPAYSGQNPADVQLTNLASDVAGITVTPTSGLTTSDAGASATFAVSLKTMPTANVSIGLSVSNPSLATLTTSTVVFNSSNWNVPQQVAVIGVVDALSFADGPQPYLVVTAPAVSTDAAYQGLNAPDVNLTSLDTDTAGIAVAPLSGLVTTESGTPAHFDVVLTSRPHFNVLVGSSSTDTSEGRVTAELLFTPENWSVAQRVRVDGVYDGIDDGNIAYQVNVGPAASSDPAYAALTPIAVSLTNIDVHNTTPSIISGGGGNAFVLSVPEKSTAVTTVSAIDPDPLTTLAFSIVGGADAARFQIDSASGALRFLAPPVHSNPTDVGANNVYEVTVQVSDGLAVDQQAISVTVTPLYDVVYLNEGYAGAPNGLTIAVFDPFTNTIVTIVMGTTGFGTLQQAANAVAPGGTIVMDPGNYPQPATLSSAFSLFVTGGSATIGGVISGAAGLTKSGPGALTLSAANTYSGGTFVQQGKLFVASESLLGAPRSPIVVSALGELTFTANSTATRTFTLEGGTLSVANGATLTLAAGAAVGGGSLKGPGAIVATGAVLSGSTTAASLTMTANGSTGLRNFTNGGLLTLTGSAALSGFTNAASGRFNVNGGVTAAVTEFTNNGQATINGTLMNSGTGLTFGGGSVTTIGPSGSIDIGAADALVAGGLVKNNGSFGSTTNTIIIDYGAKLKGTGTFGAVSTQNGGILAPGNSPGAAATNKYNVNGGGILEFEISNATGSPGNANGWDVLMVQPTTFSPAGVLALSATAADSYTILLTTLLDSGNRTTPGEAANFDATKPYAWKFADASNASSSLSGSFNPAAFTIDESAFLNPVAGTFSVELRDGGKNLYIVYTVTTATTLTATPNASTGGSLVTFTASVAPSPGNLGTVNFLDNNVIPGGSNVAVVGGVATFQVSNLPLGTHPISAAYSGAAGYAASTSNTLNHVVALVPQVIGVAVNGSIPAFAGPQRSRVASLVVTFNEPVQLDTDAFALALHTNNVSFGGTAQPAGFGSLPTSLVWSSTDNISWVVTFSGNTDAGVDGFHSLKDGVYDLRIDGAKVHPLGAPSISMPAFTPFTFHRLFGDTTAPAGGPGGNNFLAIVNSVDNLVFRGAFNNPPNYKPYLDFNGDGAITGVINSGDNLQFRNRFNKALTWSV